MAEANVIVMAEDDVRLRKLYFNLISAAGFEVFAAGDGMEALSLLRNCDPDLVLLDIMMPRLNGIDTCRQAREIVGPDIPVVFLSTLDRLDVLRDCVAAGADGYIIKSDSLPTLLERVKQWSRQGGKGNLAARRKQMLNEIARELVDSEKSNEQQPGLGAETDSDVRDITAFLNDARTLVDENFGKTVPEKLYLLGYVTGAVEFWVEGKGSLEMPFKDCLRAVMRSTKILRDHEVMEMVAAFEELSKDGNFAQGRKQGRRDPIRWRCDGDAYVPPGLALFKGEPGKSPSAA